MFRSFGSNGEAGSRPTQRNGIKGEKQQMQDGLDAVARGAEVVRATRMKAARLPMAIDELPATTTVLKAKIETIKAEIAHLEAIVVTRQTEFRAVLDGGRASSSWRIFCG